MTDLIEWMEEYDSLISLEAMYGLKLKDKRRLNNMKSQLYAILWGRK